jgi:SAM-dependent methyltransferase
MATGGREHWERIFTEKGEEQVSWFQARPGPSLELIARAGLAREARIIDVGGGASRLVDALLDEGYRDLTVLDLSAAALERVRVRLGGRAAGVSFVVADAAAWAPDGQYDLWHDRAAFHFLTEPAQRQGYRAALSAALRAGGQAILGTFAADGPERCSGLPVVRYAPEALAAELGPGFRLAESLRDEHRTPGGNVQAFQFCRFVALAPAATGVGQLG